MTSDREIDEFYRGWPHDPDVCGLDTPEIGSGNPPHCPGCMPIWAKARLRVAQAQERLNHEREFAEERRRKARAK